MEPCAICGHPKTHGAHVKPKEAWGESLPPDHRAWNIIPLCPNHHDAFDNDHTIGIAPDKTGFVILEGATPVYSPSRVNITYIKDEFVKVRNASCLKVVQIALGIVPGYERRSIN